MLHFLRFTKVQTDRLRISFKEAMARGVQTAAFGVANFSSWTSVPSVQPHRYSMRNLHITVVLQSGGEFQYKSSAMNIVMIMAHTFLVHSQTHRHGFC